MINFINRRDSGNTTDNSQQNHCQNGNTQNLARPVFVSRFVGILPYFFAALWIPGTSTLLAKRVLNNTPLAITAPIRLIHNTVERFLLGKVTNKRYLTRAIPSPLIEWSPTLFPLFATILAPFATKIPIPKITLTQ